MISRKVAIIAFYNSKNQLLLQERGSYSKNSEDWAFFGGGIEEGEIPEQGFFREAREELGLDMSKFDYKYIGELKQYYKEKDFLAIRYIFLIKTDLEPKDFTIFEGIGCDYFSVENAKKLKFPSNYDNLIDFIEQNILLDKKV